MNQNKEAYQLEIEGARFYEQNFVPALFEKWAKITVEKLDLDQSNKLLDVACGTGIVARTAYDTGKGYLEVTGCDINEGMLQMAKNINSKIKWVYGAAEDLPFKNDTFDEVSCQFGFMFFEDQVKSLNEMRRVCKKDGRIVIGVFDKIEENKAYFDFLKILEEIGGERLGRILKAPFSFGDKEQLDKIFRTSNISSYEILTIKEYVDFKSIMHWIDCDVKASPISEQIAGQQYTDLQSLANKRLKKYVTDLGHVRFPMSAHFVIID